MIARPLKYAFGSLSGFARDLLANRQLIVRMAGYELKTRYASTAIGALWALIQPVLMIVVFWFVATRGLKVTFESQTPYVLIMFTGFVPWLFFADAMSGTTNSIANYSYLVRKVAFPIHILPTVPLCAALLVHAVLFALLLGMLAWYGLFPGVQAFMVLYYLAAMVLFVLGMGWMLAAANVFSRDVGQALATGLNVLFWATPILWPAGNIQGLFKTAIQANPMYFVVEGYRSALLPGSPLFALWPLDLYFWGLTLLFLAGGAAIFKRFESDFADVLR